MITPLVPFSHTEMEWQNPPRQTRLEADRLADIDTAGTVIWSGAG